MHFDDGRSLWVGRISLGYGPDGKRVRRAVYGRTQAEARGKLDQLRRQHDAGMMPTVGREQTVGSFLPTWLEEVHRHRVRPTTYRRDEWVVRNRLVPAFGRYRLSALTPLQVEALLRQMVESGLTPRTAQHTRAVLRAALNQAARWGLVSRNVAALAQAPASDKKNIAFLNKEQAARLIVAVKGDRLEALLTVALSVGLRQGEALGLTWDAVDLEGGTVAVRQTLQRIDGEYRYLPPKTEKSRRTIPLPSIATQALRRLRAGSIAGALRAGRQWDERSLVFTNLDGEPLYGPHVTRHFQNILGKADLPRLRFHDLRHSCASLLLAQGIPLSTIQEVLGHTSYAFTRDVYAHLSDELKKNAADAIDAALGSWDRPHSRIPD